MRQLLSKHLTTDKARTEYAEWWDRAGPWLEPLAKALKELAGDGRISEDDLRSEAMAILAYRAGRRDAYLDVLDMLPDASKN